VAGWALWVGNEVLAWAFGAQRCCAPTQGARTSGADVAGVEGASDGGILGAFQDGATVGEHGHFIGRDAEAEKEIVVADVGDGGGEAGFQSGQVERASAFVDLHGIAAAHGDVGLGLAIEVRKFTAGAGAAIRVAGDAEGLETAGPNVAGDETAVEGGGASRQDFDGFGGLERSDQIDNRPEDADGVAGFLQARRLGFHQTSETGCGAGENGHGETVAGYRGGINPGLAVLDGEIVDKEASFEIVGAVKDKIGRGEQLGSVAGAEVGNDAFEQDGGIDGAKLALGGDGFGESGEGVGFVEKGLALEIGRFDEITIDYAKLSDSGADQEVGGSGSNGAATDDNGAGGEEALLAFFAEGSEENLTRVFFVEGRIHSATTFSMVRGPDSPKWPTHGRPIHDSAKVRGRGNAAMLRFV